MNDNNTWGNWYNAIAPDGKLLIAGPCSAETQEQVLSTAVALKDKVHFFRAGIWKPRTRPGGFEGVGAIGLQWLQKVKEQTGLKVATEVASRVHCELALQHDIDLLWIGARTTVSPFVVQEIADTLQGTDKIVLVKNPVNPDLALWIGALERLTKAGIAHLGVIHRGFSSYEKVKYRNLPHWQMVIDLQTRFPSLPIICDPSHITGARELLGEVAQIALDMNLHGLMIETHPTPDEAWSDAAQQITPHQLFTLLSGLHYRRLTSPEEQFQARLCELRSQIDMYDAQLISLLEKRMNIVQQIGALKREKNVAILQHQRWVELLEQRIAQGQKQGLSSAFLSDIFKVIHQASIEQQEKITPTNT